MKIYPGIKIVKSGIGISKLFLTFAEILSKASHVGKQQVV